LLAKLFEINNAVTTIPILAKVLIIEKGPPWWTTTNLRRSGCILNKVLVLRMNFRIWNKFFPKREGGGGEVNKFSFK
jgi:hypothetical protein